LHRNLDCTGYVPPNTVSRTVASSRKNTATRVSEKKVVAFRFVQEGPTKASRRGGKNAARSRRLRISAWEPNGTGSVAPARAPCGESSCGCARPRGIFRRWRTRQRGEGRGGSGWGPGGERGNRRRRCLARADVAGIFAPAVAASRRATRSLADPPPRPVSLLDPRIGLRPNLQAPVGVADD